MSSLQLFHKLSQVFPISNGQIFHKKRALPPTGVRHCDLGANRINRYPLIMFINRIHIEQIGKIKQTVCSSLNRLQ